MAAKLANGGKIRHCARLPHLETANKMPNACRKRRTNGRCCLGVARPQDGRLVVTTPHVARLSALRDSMGPVREAGLLHPARSSWEAGGRAWCLGYMEAAEVTMRCSVERRRNSRSVPPNSCRMRATTQCGTRAELASGNCQSTMEAQFRPNSSGPSKFVLRISCQAPLRLLTAEHVSARRNCRKPHKTKFQCSDAM